MARVSAPAASFTRLALPVLGEGTMTTPVDSVQTQLRFRSIQAEAHPFCFVCSGSNPMGLALKYGLQADGGVTATFLGNCALEGYSGLLHGGVIAAMLDGAMTNCLFARGIRAVTAELKVRYLAPIMSAESVNVRAWLEESSRHGLFLLRGEVIQGGKIKARAHSKFVSHA
jgi:acyl-coenzyme A thioesterase PaaI-like protein